MNHRAERQWTVLLYMMSDVKNLLPYAEKVLSTIGSLPSSRKVRVVAQVTFPSSWKRRIRRYDFAPDSPGKVHLDKKGRPYTEPQLAPTRKQTPRHRLTSFLRWGKKTFPARHYFVILWGHAWGVDYTFPSEKYKRHHLRKKINSQSRLILGSPHSANHLSNKDMQMALLDARSGRPFDLLGMDACLMSMAEICYDLRESAQYTVASEGLDPLEGWPYSTILRSLIRNPTVDSTALGREVIRNFRRTYREWHSKWHKTISLCSLKYSSELAGSVRLLVDSLTPELQDRAIRSALIRARKSVARENMPAYVDLYDFCRLLEGQPAIRESPVIHDACGRVQHAIRDRFVQIFGLAREQNSFGLSIYFPSWLIGRKHTNGAVGLHIPERNAYGVPVTLRQVKEKIAVAYTAPDFAVDTGWGNFLLGYIKSRMPME
jgi:hypothetical protein